MLDSLLHLWHAITAIPHLRAYLTGAWTIYVVWLCMYVLLQKREPAATLSWILMLGAIPYFGFAIYFFLGPQRVRPPTLTPRPLAQRPRGV